MPSHDGELGLRVGDLVISVKELGNGWSLGRNDNADSSCRVGIFPSRNVRPLPTFVAIPKVPSAVHRGGASDEEHARKSNGRRKLKEINELTMKLSVCNNREKVPDHENDLNQESPALTEQNRVRSKATSPVARRLHPHSKDPANSFSVAEPDSIISTPKRGRPGQKPHMVVKPNQDKLFDDSFERIDDVVPIRRQDDVQPDYQCVNSWGDQAEELYLPVDSAGQRPANPNLWNWRSLSLLDMPTRCGGGGSDSLGTSGAIPPSMTLMELDSAASHQQDYYSVDQSPTASVVTPMRRLGRPPPTETKRFCVDYRALTATTASSSAVDLSSSNSVGVRHKAILKPRKQRVADSNAQHVYYADSTSGHKKSCRLVGSVGAGLTIGVLVFFWMFYHMDYNHMVSAIFAVLLTVLLCLLLSLSRMVRCVAALLLPSLCTARGRAAFTVFLFGFLLSGPVGNIYVNMAEISRSMSCSAEQSYRQTLLLLEPFDAMMEQLNRTIVSLQDAAHNVSRGLEPLDHGLERVELDVNNGNVQLHGTRKVYI